jgi:Ca2+-binding EF-hand superfamily protein
MKTRTFSLFLRAIPALALAASMALASAQPASGPQPFSAIDTDGDGFISRDEFAAARTQRVQERATQGGQMRGLATASSFDSLDADQDGKLSPEEFAAGQQAQRGKRGGSGGRSVGKNVAPFQDFDLNGDGQIDQMELPRLA